MNSYEDDDIANEVDLVVSAYPVQDDGLDEELLAAGNVPLRRFFLTFRCDATLISDISPRPTFSATFPLQGYHRVGSGSVSSLQRYLKR